MPSRPNRSPSSDDGEDRAVAADEEGAHLAVAAEADAAVHVSFERHEDPAPRDPRRPQRRDGGLHHPLRPAQECDRLAPAPVALVEELGHHADLAQPSGPARSTICATSMPLCRPSVELLERRAGQRRARAVGEEDSAEPVRWRQDASIERPRSGRQADAAGHDDDVAAQRSLDRPASPSGPRRPTCGARLQCGHRLGCSSGGADR